MKKVLIGIAIVLVGWALAVFIPWRKGEERPGEVLKRYYAAENAHDTAALLQTFSKHMIEYTKNNPASMQIEYDWWKRRVQTDVDILWDSVDGNVGYVKYHLTRTHKGKSTDTVAHMQVYKEDGEWKIGGW